VSLDTVKRRVDEIQHDRSWLAFPYAVIKKFGEDSSSNLAVLITYYTFFSVFPLLLALFSVMGFVLHGHPSWQQSIRTSTFKQLPLIKGGPLPAHGSVVIVIVGVALALYSGLGVAKAAQNAWDVVYCVPKDERPGFVPKNLRALRLVVVGGLGFIATTAVSASVASGSAFGLHLGKGLHVLAIPVAVVLNVVLFAVVFRWLTVREVTFREVLPGAGLSAVALALLQSIATAFIAHKLKGAKATYGAFGTVIVLLSWFYLQSQVLLIAAQVNVVKQDHLWPRSLREEPGPDEDSAVADPARGHDGDEVPDDGKRSERDDHAQ
jgi:YihY family inner membrane protein